MLKRAPKILLLIFIAMQIGGASAFSDDALFVVQPKTVSFANRWEISLLGTYDLNDRFVFETGPVLSLSYFIRNHFAVELEGGWMCLRGSHPFSELMEIQKGYFFPLSNYHRVSWLTSLNFLWMPVDIKAYFLDRYLADVGFYVLVGAGALGLEVPQVLWDQTSKADKDKLGDPFSWQWAANFGMGTRFYFSEYWGGRLELKDSVSMLGFKNDPVIAHKVWLSLGVSYGF